jgi:hypothetical protein
MGNIKDTCRDFFAKREPAPIGCIFHDLDFFSSTKDAFTLFEADHAHFLPRIFIYLDDINGANTFGWSANLLKSYWQ